MNKFFALAGRSILSATIYTVSFMLLGALMNLVFGSIAMAPPDLPLTLATTFGSGLLIGITLGPMAMQATASRRRRMLAWILLLFCNITSVIIEGYFFAPGLMPLSLVPRMLVQFLLLAVITGLAIDWLYPAKHLSVHRTNKIPRSYISLAFRFAGSALSYLLFYYLFGAVNYELVTKPYYEAHGGLAVPNAGTVLVAESIRAVLIVLSLLPLMGMLRVSRNRLVLICGMALFVIGGIIPLSMQIHALPARLLVASAVEIFFQNFLTGAVAALLLGPQVRRQLQPQERLTLFAIE